jgi:hypothetical protein
MTGFSSIGRCQPTKSLADYNRKIKGKHTKNKGKIERLTHIKKNTY